MEQQKKIQAGDWLIFTGLSVVWGFSFFFIKKGLEVFEPMQVAAFRMSIAFLALIPLIILHYKKLKIPRSKWKYIPLLGLFGNLIPAILFCTAETKIDSGLTGMSYELELTDYSSSGADSLQPLLKQNFNKKIQ